MHINLFPLGACLRGVLSGADIAHIQSYQWGENHGLQAFEVFTSSSSGCPRASSASPQNKRVDSIMK